MVVIIYTKVIRSIQKLSRDQMSLPTKYQPYHYLAMSRLHISGLGPDPDRKNVGRQFEYYGELTEVWLSKRHSGHALIEYNTARDGMLSYPGCPVLYILYTLYLIIIIMYNMCNI